MRGFQAACLRLLMPLHYEKDEREIVLRLAVGIYQLRVEFVGITQIRTVYGVQEWTVEQDKEDLPRYRRDCADFFQDFPTP